MEDRITVNPKMLLGKPVIKGTRISVELILELLSSGMSINDILKDYPHLKKADLLAALRYATGVLKHEEVYPVAEIA